ncbi:hypothetical protein PACTADRAFT_48805 [Pachysolen tannophilus NRRL Y-2460]|uniref:HhH-GPD domain-containing protein n=1 Tax=Pachysolen tannophilus NRRL Y-2460 TaxID=669874 RepID=A0A1E4TZ65_PACTA|nr:hypothetical protein PACTADRAFT_48805 [Pachysolen tannophilus NRRL Y-2460]
MSERILRSARGGNVLEIEEERIPSSISVMKKRSKRKAPVSASVPAPKVQKVQKVDKIPDKTITTTTTTTTTFEIVYYANLKIPPSVEFLGEEFISNHEENFVQGLKFIVNKDPSLLPVVLKNKFKQFLKNSGTTREKTDHFYFEGLINGIISQQLSGKAAESIKLKLMKTLNKKQELTLPSAKIFYETSEEILRSCGLSHKKIEYIKSLSKSFYIDKKLNKFLFENSTDEEIYEILISYKGIGPWSVVMFLLFCLKRLNVFSHKDLGILRGGSIYLNERPELLKEIKAKTLLKSKKKQQLKKRNWSAVEEEYVETLSEAFSPFKSCLMLILWRISDVNINVLDS